MEHYLSLYVNASIIAGCIIMSVVFLTIPLPATLSLTKYRISLRFLSLAYFTIAFLKLLAIFFQIRSVTLLAMDGMLIASLQAVLFTFSLITLLNPLFVRKQKILTHLIPVFVFTLLFVFTACRWGNPTLSSYSDWGTNWRHPCCVVRELFVVYYVIQLIYLSFTYFQQLRLLEKKGFLFSTNPSCSSSTGVTPAFCGALAVGVLAIISFLIYSLLINMLFEIAYFLFYFLFGLYYIQYPAKYLLIRPLVVPLVADIERPGSVRRKLDWMELKNQIIENKYYLKPGITIEDMARCLKIGRTSLSNFINNEEGMNFNCWINSLRVEEAKVLLLAYPEYNLIKIAELIGYSEPSNFSRQFKIITKETPSVWRQENHHDSNNISYTMN